MWKEFLQFKEPRDLNKFEYEDYYSAAKNQITRYRRWAMIYSRLGWAGVLFYQWVPSNDVEQDRWEDWVIFLGILENEGEWLKGQVKDRLGDVGMELFEPREPPDFDHLINILDRLGGAY